MGIPRFCTCKTCNGKTVHNNSDPITPTNIPTNTQIITKPSTFNTPFSINHPNSDRLNAIKQAFGDSNITIAYKLSGRNCIVCGKRKTGSIRIPPITFGAKKFVICSKKDIPISLRYLEHYTSKDLNIDKNKVIIYGSDDEDQYENVDKKSDFLCQGYTVLRPRHEPCQLFCKKKHLKLYEKDGDKSFCKPSHLVRYLMVWYAPRRSSFKNQTPRKNQKKIQDEDDDDEDEEDYEDDEDEENEEIEEFEEDEGDKMVKKNTSIPKKGKSIISTSPKKSIPTPSKPAPKKRIRKTNENCTVPEVQKMGVKKIN
ncbi:hypothetical protein DICPUDRAFT_74727 [Dictyostelium purpureum]|uniref:Uncharacterized protein n=1 Tax=Dictyostelium purpureum TaxID=5786 RepID=F0Z8K5_DICPU|nr:uncharacterized protein DICPUDRAFT_74727 [Dictyostelium purpureum]EGC39742.1 hypothetical protein DICPUDRAFT_74727 [Dictyostelium purpureum]|eukprot:XP_003283728.1 hypothetical protein DICPUDRAFT_74727 [Dictyostelium purpureum]